MPRERDAKRKPGFQLLRGHPAWARAGTGAAGAPQDFSDVLKPSDPRGQGKRTSPVPSTRSPNDRIGIRDVSMSSRFLQNRGVITKYCSLLAPPGRAISLLSLIFVIFLDC